MRLAEALARVDPGQPVLVEVNVAREPQKSGADRITHWRSSRDADCST